jgi:hypothetical protein
LRFLDAVCSILNTSAALPGLFLLVVVLGLDLLLLLGGGWRLDRYEGPDRFLLRFLFFREPQPGLRHLDQGGARCFKGNEARSV